MHCKKLLILLGYLSAISAILPIPARCVVDRSGAIVYTAINPDYARRPELSDLLAVLDSLAAAPAQD